MVPIWPEDMRWYTFRYAVSLDEEAALREARSQVGFPTGVEIRIADGPHVFVGAETDAAFLYIKAVCETAINLT